MRVRREDTGQIIETGVCSECGQPKGSNEFCLGCADYNEDAEIEKDIGSYIEENESEVN